MKRAALCIIAITMFIASCKKDNTSDNENSNGNSNLKNTVY